MVQTDKVLEFDKMKGRLEAYAVYLLHKAYKSGIDFYDTAHAYTDSEKKLGEDFYRTHRSYLVSLRHVERISRTSVVMDSGDELPLARGKYDGINRAFIEHG